MSPPPDADLDRQKRRHAGPLIGMAVLLALVIAGFFWYFGRATDDPDTPAEAAGEAQPAQN